MSRVRLSVAPISRVVLFRCAGKPPTVEEATAAADAWLNEHVPEPLRERAVAWEREHPLEAEVRSHRGLFDPDDLATVLAGAEEVATARRATHAVIVRGRSDATAEGWLGVGAYARGVARAFGGAVLDPSTGRFRPLDECRSPLAEVVTAEVAGSLSLPTGPNRWVFMTHGLGNLGLPEVWFDDVPATQVATGVTVVQGLRDEIAGRARAHARARGLDGLVVPSLDVPGFGRVGLAEAWHPLVGRSLRAFAVDRPRTPLGRLLGRTWGAARRGAAPVAVG